jgi:hypothetical protein
MIERIVLTLLAIVLALIGAGYLFGVGFALAQ